MSEEWLHRIFGMEFLSCVVLLATWDNAFSFAFFCFIFCEKISLLFTFLNAFRKLQLLHDSSLLASSISLRLCADKRENFFRLQIKGWTGGPRGVDAFTQVFKSVFWNNYVEQCLCVLAIEASCLLFSTIQSRFEGKNYVDNDCVCRTYQTSLESNSSSISSSPAAQIFFSPRTSKQS